MNQPLDRANMAQAADALPSWNDGPARRSIVEFVARVTTPGSPEFVPIAERIALFDNDGTLWAEQPMFFQALFAFDRIRQLAPQHPEWKTTEPFASVLRGDEKSALAGGDACARRDGHGLARGHDDGGVRDDCDGLDRDRAASEDREALHRDGLPTHARTARLPARERIQDVHRFRRRHRVHARLQRTGLWRPARAGDWHQHQDEVRAAGRQAGARASAGNELH